MPTTPQRPEGPAQDPKSQNNNEQHEPAQNTPKPQYTYEEPQPQPQPQQPQQGPFGHAAPQQPAQPTQPSYAAPAGQLPITIQMPEQKTSKAPWIILAIFVLLITLVMASCAAMPFMAMKSFGDALSSGDFKSLASAPEMTTMAYQESVGVLHMDQQISANPGSTNPEDIRKALKAAAADKNIKAVVVRCNCPGGTVAASEEIAQYIKEFPKPIVFSVSDLCASGGYMAASQSDYIFAMQTSSVGSIGVIMQTLDISGLLDKYGISMGSIKSADSKDAGAIYRSLTDEERAKFQKEVEDLNNIFIDIVAEGRNMQRDKVASLATGELYFGEIALQDGLIDELGTYDDALKKAAELGGMDPENVKVYSLDGIASPFSLRAFMSENSGLDFAKNNKLVDNIH